jgi:ribonuclease III
MLGIIIHEAWMNDKARTLCYTGCKLKCADKKSCSLTQFETFSVLAGIGHVHGGTSVRNNADEVLSAFRESTGLDLDNMTLLRTALTHGSFLNEHANLDWEDNERLEFLGDAVLDLLLGDYLFHAFPAAKEGQLTSLRAALVRRSTLARFARSLDLGSFLFMGHGEVETGGRDRDATLCAAFEALIGALYLDKDMARVADLVMPMVSEEIEGASADVADKDPKSRLQEFAQGMLGVTPRYQTIGSEGPDHAKTFTVSVYVGDRGVGTGVGHSKQLAAQEAAADAFAHLDTWYTVESEVGAG